MERQVNILLDLPKVLLPWFYATKRDLPWRTDRNPYHIWLSEIMLQQTRVEAVKGYYARFLQHIPNIETLAKADDDLLNKLWEGLGYYSRVRNLKKAAIIICEQYDGVFPEEYNDVIKLPGIGEYTAGAICSIAYDQSVAAVDGNVLRVYSRLMNDPTPIDLPVMKKKTAQALQAVYPENAGDFTQALMELGATVCGPNKKPDCANCPCNAFCKAHMNNTAEMLPVKLPKKERRQADLTVFILECNGKYAVEKRKEKGLLSGLWQLPNTSGHLSESQTVEYLKKENIVVTDIFRCSHKSHIFTHIQWNMRGFYLQVKNTDGPYQWFSAEQIDQTVALPTAFRIFWEDRDI